MDLMIKHSVDLVVVGANKLEARRLKETLKSIAGNVKTNAGEDFGQPFGEEKKSGGRRSSKKEHEEAKEAIVIWGSLEIPKLFSTGHYSSKLLKDQP
jgi:hypothetical protein